MCVCIYLHICTPSLPLCMRLSIYRWRVHVCVYIFTYISRSLHVCVFMSMCVCTQTLHVYVYVYIYDAESVCVCVYVYMFVHGVSMCVCLSQKPRRHLSSSWGDESRGGLHWMVTECCQFFFWWGRMVVVRYGRWSWCGWNFYMWVRWFTHMRTEIVCVCVYVSICRQGFPCVWVNVHVYVHG